MIVLSKFARGIYACTYICFIAYRECVASFLFFSLSLRNDGITDGVDIVNIGREFAAFAFCPGTAAKMNVGKRTIKNRDCKREGERESIM